jgi:hypothetical protein
MSAFRIYISHVQTSRRRLAVPTNADLEASFSNLKQDTVPITGAVTPLLTAFAIVFILLVFAALGAHIPVALFSFYYNADETFP